MKKRFYKGIALAAAALMTFSVCTCAQAEEANYGIDSYEVPCLTSAKWTRLIRKTSQNALQIYGKTSQNGP